MAGLIYGVYHQSSLNTKAKSAEIDREYKRKESLIEQAKAEWKKKTLPADKKTESGGSMLTLIAPLLYSGRPSGGRELLCEFLLTHLATVITDPEDSRFDLEAFLTSKAAEAAK